MRKELTGTLTIGQRSYAADELDIQATDFKDWFPPAEDEYEVTADGTPLVYVPWEKYRVAFDIGQHEPGPPVFYSISPDKRIHFGPTPDREAVIRASYYKQPTELVEPGDEPDMPAEFHMILVWRALMELASFDAAPEVYSRALMNFNNLENDLFSDQGPKVRFKRVRL